MGQTCFSWFLDSVICYVGFDYDYEGLFSTIDSITVRYNKAKNRYPDFPKATIFHADGKALLNSTAQSKAIPSMSEKNKKNFTKKYIYNKCKRR